MPQLTPEMMRFRDLAASVRNGRPRPFIEAYLKIQPEDPSTPLVPMLFSNEPNQEYYYEQLLPSLRGDPENEDVAKQRPPWQVDVLTFKDRKARWTAFETAVLFSKMLCIPGTHIFCLTNAEDTFTAVNRFMAGYYNNLPRFIKEALELRGGKWASESNTFSFKTATGGEITSSFTIRTAANPNVGTGETPTDVVFEEYPKFPGTFSQDAQSSIRAAMPSSTSFWRGGTVGPDGPDCAMYKEIQQIKAGERQTLYLFRTWFQNPANHLKPGSRLRRPVDLRDEFIVLGVDGGANCEKESALVAQFPDDGIPWEWRIAWRRAKMADALLAAGGPGNEDAAAILFQREHCEDDVTPWLIAGRSQFSIAMMELSAGIAKSPENKLMVNEEINGLRLRAWRGYDSSHVYILGMDFGSGTQGDDTTGQLFDATAMTFMGEYHGNVTEPYHACAGGKIVMSKFGNGLWIPETNRFPGIGNHIKRTLGYQNVFKAPRRQKETPEHYADRPYGMHVGDTFHSEKEPSAEEMLGRFKTMFNNGGFKVLNPFLLETMQRWNPDRDKHCPDRLAGARLCLLGLDIARTLQPVTGAPAVIRPNFHLMGHGRRTPTPFVRINA